jgi:hypothetical protein
LVAIGAPRGESDSFVTANDDGDVLIEQRASGVELPEKATSNPLQIESRASGSCGEKYALFRALEVPRLPLMVSDQKRGDDVRVRLAECCCERRASLERHCEHILRESK